MADATFRLDGKTAIITGGGTGLGKAMAEAFAAAGARVAVAGRTRAALDAVAATTGGLAVACDVTRLGDAEALFGQVMRWTGRVDVLVNSAGISGPVGPVATVDLEAWRECFDVNVMGALHCMRLASPIMTAQKSGSIINLSSVLGFVGTPNRTAYCVAKAATNSMTESVARELGAAGVRVNAISAGSVAGDLMEQIIAARAKREGRTPEAVKKGYVDYSELKRFVEPEEIARAALFLASDASSAMTGQIVKVDCGRF